MDTKKKLGLGACIATGIGAIIGAGIFGTLPTVVSDVGSFAVPAIAIATVYMFMVMIPILYTTSVVPASGGLLLWSTKLIYPAAGILTAMIYLLGAPVSIAYYSVLFGNYISVLAPTLAGKETLAAIALVIIMGLIACLGNYTFATINSIVVVVLFITCGVYAFGGLHGIDANIIDLKELFSSGIKLSSAAVAVSAFAQCLSGGSETAQISSDVKNPEKNIPRAAFISTCIVAVLYIFMAIVTLYYFEGNDISTLADVAAKFMPRNLMIFFVIFGPVIGVATSLPPALMSSTAIIKASIDCGILPEKLSKENRHSAPIFILAYIVALALVFIFAGSTFSLLMLVASALRMMLSIIVCFLPFKLIKMYPHSCNHAGLKLNKKFVLVDSVIACVLSAYLAVETIRSLNKTAVLAQAIYIALMLLFLLLRIKHLKKQGRDLIAELHSPYQPWEEQEAKWREQDLI